MTQPTSAATTSSVVIVGAGYAGLLCATRLARKTRGLPINITLVNETDTFTERLRLHEYAANHTIPWRSIPATLAGTGVDFVQSRVAAIDPQRKEIILAGEGGERRLAYDKLIVALGSATERASVPGVAVHAYTLAPRGPLSAEAMRAALPALPADARVVVCGAGPTGIETAAELKSSYPQLAVSLVTEGAFGAFIGERVARYMRHSLERQRVAIIEQARIAEVGADSVALADGRRLPCDLCVWAGGFIALPLAREAGLTVNERDQIIIDPYMRSISDPDIFAIGDAAYTREEPGAPLRMSAVTALILGAHGADCVSALLRGKTPQPLSFGYNGQGIALGHGDGIGFSKTADDIARAPYFTGRLAADIRAFGLNYLATSAARDKHRLGAFIWTGKGRYAKAQRHAGQSRVAEAAPATVGVSQR